MDYNAIAKDMITAALSAGRITRSDFNYARRCGGLMEDDTSKLWHALNGAIWNLQVEIVEDGDTVFEVSLSFDVDNLVIGVL